MCRGSCEPFSAHAGRTELIKFGQRFKNSQHVLLVHGEEEAMAALKSTLESAGQTNVKIQKEGVPVEF